eukprot:gi/632973268/ref/XP_007903071.1/ PREDICTED: syntaxin-binding protein 4-like [Callorhinchus milii]
MPTFAVLYKGAVIISRTLLGPYGVDRNVHCVDFTDCENGLGIKVIGGVKEVTGEEYGVYVKRILPGGLASVNGRLHPGDQILEVNGESLVGVTNESAVEVLRAASSSNSMRLMIARDEQGRREFTELLEKYTSSSSTGSARSSPVPQGSGRYLDSVSSGSSSSSQSPQQLSPVSSHSSFNGNTGSLLRSSSHYPGDAGIQLVNITKTTGLGLVITGGANRPDGPNVFVEDVVSGGDCHRDGRLRPGDQLIAINKKSLIGVTLEDAQTILNKINFRWESALLIAFIPGKGPLHPGTSLNNDNHSAQKNVGNGCGSSRLKVHVGTSKPRHEDHLPVSSSSPDICPPELTISAATPSAQKEAASSKQKVSLDPHVRLKMDKLDLALMYLGLDVTEERRRELKQSLTADSQGTVAFGVFVQAARDYLQEEMEEVGLSQSPPLFSPNEVANLLDTSAFHSPFTSNIARDTEELEQLHTEMAELHQEVNNLKALMIETEKSKKSLEDELQHLSQKATDALVENRTLQNKLQLADAVQCQAHSAEQDYEEVIRLLEAEITELKIEQAGKQQVSPGESTKEDVQELRRRLSIIDCQLRKSELDRKHLEISNKRLLSFAENVHKVLTSANLVGVGKGVNQLMGSTTEDGLALPPPPEGPARLLAAEAKQLVEGVFSFRCGNALPYGWEECCTPDGAKYYIDHVHQKTTWSPPPGTSTKEQNNQPEADCSHRST